MSHIAWRFDPRHDWTVWRPLAGSYQIWNPLDTYAVCLGVDWTVWDRSSLWFTLVSIE